MNNQDFKHTFGDGFVTLKFLCSGGFPVFGACIQLTLINPLSITIADSQRPQHNEDSEESSSLSM